MVYSEVSKNKFLIRLVKGENVLDCILKFCEKNEIKNAYLTAIGAIESPTLSYYEVKVKKYFKKKFEGDFELTSLIGNIAVFENKPLLHAHVNIGDKKMNAYGGHFVSANVAASVEIVLDVWDTKFEKSPDKNIGLNLWSLPKKL